MYETEQVTPESRTPPKKAGNARKMRGKPREKEVTLGKREVTPREKEVTPEK